MYEDFICEITIHYVLHQVKGQCSFVLNSSVRGHRLVCVSLQCKLSVVAHWAMFLVIDIHVTLWTKCN